MDQEITQLEKRLSDLNNWKDEIETERLSFPLDLPSRKTLDYLGEFGNLIFTGNVIDLPDIIYSDFIAFGIDVRINDQNRIVLAAPKIFQFTANDVTDILTSVGPNNLINGDAIAFNSTNLLPGNLNPSSGYYVINRSGTTFQVSATSGGSAIDITDTGSGTHYFSKL